MNGGILALKFMLNFFFIILVTEWFMNGDRIYPNDRTQIDSEPNGKYFEENKTCKEKI